MKRVETKLADENVWVGMATVAAALRCTLTMDVSICPVIQ